MSRQVFHEFKDKLFKFIRGRVSSKEDAEDLMQEVFLKIHAYEGSLNDIEKMESWIYQITRNTIIDYYRKKGQTSETLYDGEMEDLLGSSSEPHQNDNLNEMVSSWLKGMIETLPDHYQEALLRTEFQNVKQRELAEELGLSVSGVKSRVQRARKKLKQSLQECCHLELDTFGNVLDYEQKQSYCSYCQKE